MHRLMCGTEWVQVIIRTALQMLLAERKAEGPGAALILSPTSCGTHNTSQVLSCLIRKMGVDSLLPGL